MPLARRIVLAPLAMPLALAPPPLTPVAPAAPPCAIHACAAAACTCACVSAAVSESALSCDDGANAADELLGASAADADEEDEPVMPSDGTARNDDRVRSTDFGRPVGAALLD